MKNYSKTEGIFVDSSNNEQEGSRYRFLLDGIAKYSLVVEYIKFLDGTGIIGLGGDFAGPKLLYDNLYSRLRIGTFKLDDKSWCEIRIPRKSDKNPNRLTAQKVLLEDLDSRIGMTGVKDFFLGNGALDLDTREVLIGDESNRKRLSIIWNHKDLVFPIVVFVLSRLVPVTQELLKQKTQWMTLLFWRNRIC